MSPEGGLGSGRHGGGWALTVAMPVFWLWPTPPSTARTMRIYSDLVSRSSREVVVISPAGERVWVGPGGSREGGRRGREGGPIRLYKLTACGVHVLGCEVMLMKGEGMAPLPWESEARGGNMTL